MTAAPFKAACVQLRTGRNVQENIEAASALIRAAHGAGAQFIATPETTSLMELKADVLFATCVEEAKDPALLAFRQLAEELSVWLLVGSLALRVAPDKVVNRSLLIGPDGSLKARYDKIHMFDVDLPGGESYRESKNYRAGTEAVIADLPWGRLGLSVCYDLRFPYLYRQLAKTGASFLTVPSAFTQKTGEAHWHVLLRARAIETGCFVIAPAQGGAHENGRQTYGHSLIISPWGEILAEAAQEPTFILAEIDPAKVAEARSRIPALDHDRAVLAPSGAFKASGEA